MYGTVRGNILCLVLLLTVSAHSTLAVVEVALEDGVFGSNEGRVLVRDENNAMWGFVCDDSFHDNEASVVCRQLGYSFGKPRSDNFYGDSQGAKGFLLDDVHCSGTETDLGGCRGGQLKATGCRTTDRYASVCCSNSSSFGEKSDDVFIGHCSSTWLEAKDRCAEFGYALYKENRSSPITVNKMVAEQFWIGEYFTPWIWSHGCYGRLKDTSVDKVFTMTSGSPTECLQHCGTANGTLLGVSQRQCVCLRSKAGLQVMEPACCKPRDQRTVTSGISGPRCSRTTLTVYSTDPSDTAFHKFMKPEENQQCAVLTHIHDPPIRKLNSAGCDENHGYVCEEYVWLPQGVVKKYITIPMNENRPMYYLSAKEKCLGLSGSYRLAGSDVMTAELDHLIGYDNFWVDVTRHLVSVRDKDAIADKDKRWCVYAKRSPLTSASPVTYQRVIADCNDVHPFLCVAKQGTDAPNTTRQTYEHTTPMSTATPSTPMTSHGKNSTVSEASAVLLDDNTIIYTVAVITGTVLVAVVIVVAAVVCFRRDTVRAGGSTFYPQSESTGQQSQPTSEVIVSNSRHNASSYGEETHSDGEQEDNYAVIDNEVPDSGHYYSIEGDSNTSMTDTDNHCPSVRVKQYYDSPLDTVHVQGRCRPGKKHSVNRQSDKYVYPYDSLHLKKEDGHHSSVKLSAETENESHCSRDGNERDNENNYDILDINDEADHTSNVNQPVGTERMAPCRLEAGRHGNEHENENNDGR